MKIVILLISFLTLAGCNLTPGQKAEILQTCITKCETKVDCLKACIELTKDCKSD